MSSELLFTDDIVIEDFQESTPEIRKNSVNICKTELSNIILINSKPKNSGSKLSQSKFLNSTDLKVSSCLNNFEKSCFIDTISLGSESIEETCSGSSLHRFDSPNNSDSFDDETFLEDIQNIPSKTDNKPKNNIFTTEMLKDTFLNELKTAIKIKWIDRAIYIKKTIQQKSQDLWDSYFKSLTFEEQLAISEIQDLKSVDSITETDELVVDEDVSSKTLKHANEDKFTFLDEEIEYLVENSRVDQLAPQLVESDKETCTTFLLPKLEDVVYTKIGYNICPSDKATFVVSKKPKLVRSKSDSRPNQYEKLLMESKTHFHTVYQRQCRAIESLQNHNKSLIYEINNGQTTLEKMQHINNQLSMQMNQRVIELRTAYGTVQQFKSELSESQKNVHKIQSDNINLHKINESLVLFKTNAEDFILNEKKNNHILSKQIENFNAIESEYQWLYKAFMDYKNLGQDYDNLQFNYFEIQMKLNEVTKTVDTLQNQIAYLEQERCNNQMIIDEIKKTNRNERHENTCQCQPVADCHCCSHSRSRSGHSKHKKEKKSKRQSQHSEESDSEPKPVYKPEITVPLDKNYYKQEIHETPKVDIKDLERRYDSLQIKKRTLESELSHVPINGTSSIRQSHAASRGEKEHIENELDVVDQEISSIRRTLKQYNVMGDRSSHYNKTS